ncbi:MAG: hypothetical protein ABQ298_13760 [Puniceicoccaceae bacterium]
MKTEHLWRIAAVLLTTLLVAGMMLAYAVLPQPQLILRVESETDQPALLYADDGNGLQEIPSLLNSYRSRQQPAQMQFPLHPTEVRFLRWDPVPFSEATPVQITVHHIALQPSPLAKPISIPLSHLIPIHGVHREQTIEGTAIHLHIDAHTHDPMMELRLPDSLSDDMAAAQRIVVIKLFFIACTTLLLSFLMLRLQGANDKPILRPAP